MIELKDLSVEYSLGAESFRALDQVSLSVGEGEWLSVLGSNGSGKTTLLKAVAGAVAPSAGSLRLCGQDMRGVPQHERAPYLQFIEQETERNIVPSMTVEENLLLGLVGGRPGLRVARNAGRKADIRRCLARLEMGIEDRLSTQARFLSGGQRQALAVARTMLGQAKILLLDEFVAALDPKAAPHLLAVVRRLAEDLKLTVIMVSHDLEQAASLESRVVFLDRGRITADILKTQATKEQLQSFFLASGTK